MKRMIVFMLCMSIVLMLAGCGAIAPEPTLSPSPAAETAPAQPEVSAAATEPPVTAEPEASPEATDSVDEPEYPIIAAIGEPVSADLDLDGTKENICVSLRQNFEGEDIVCLKINGVDCSDELYVEGLTSLTCPDPDYWMITDIYGGDSQLEIAIQDWGDSDDYFTNFYRFWDGSVYSIGGVPGIIKTAWSENGITFDGCGRVFSMIRLDVLQTWFADAEFEINNAEMLSVVPEELYYANYPTDVLTKTALTAYDGRDGESFTIDAGVSMTVMATDNCEWIYCESETEDWALWFRIDPENGCMIETPYGYVYVWDALEGLSFAD